MASVLETTSTGGSSAFNAQISAKKSPRLRDEKSVRRFLLKHKGYEYVNGKLEKKKMPNAKHSGIATRLTIELGIFLKKNKLGRVYGDNTLFQVGANTRIPDVAFVSAEKIPAEGEPVDIWNFAPDLAVEIISPTEFHNKVERKIREYFAAGTRQVWKIVPEFKTLTIYYSPTEMKVLTGDETLNGEEILPNFRLKLSDIFID